MRLPLLPPEVRDPPQQSQAPRQLWVHLLRVRQLPAHLLPLHKPTRSMILRRLLPPHRKKPARSGPRKNLFFQRACAHGGSGACTSYLQRAPIHGSHSAAKMQPDEAVRVLRPPHRDDAISVARKHTKCAARAVSRASERSEPADAAINESLFTQGRIRIRDTWLQYMKKNFQNRYIM